MQKMSSNQEAATAADKQQQVQVDHQEIELIDIEDIVPVSNANSLFLCVSRALIYMAYKNEQLLKALETCCSIKRSDLKSDIHFQSVLRLRLCEHILNSAIGYDSETQMPFLKPEYAAHFEDNIYDFLIQLYQMSINNFTSNSLYNKFAFKAMSKMLHLTICLKKVNGTWKYYEPISQEKLASQHLYETIDGTSSSNDTRDGGGLLKEYRELAKYLNELNIYLYEFRTSSSKHRRKSMNAYACSTIEQLNNGLKRQYASVAANIADLNKENNLNKMTTATTAVRVSFASSSATTSSSSSSSNGKILKILMSKRLWLKNFYENSRILSKFSQFNDPDELHSYNEQRILLNPLKLINVFRGVMLKHDTAASASAAGSGGFKATAPAAVRRDVMSLISIFSAFVLNVPADLLMNCERDPLPLQSQPMDQVLKKSKTENQNQNYYSDNGLLQEVFFSSKYNTIGKQFAKFFDAKHSRHPRYSPQDMLMMFLNHIWGKQVFNQEFVQASLNYFASNQTINF